MTATSVTAELGGREVISAILGRPSAWNGAEFWQKVSVKDTQELFFEEKLLLGSPSEQLGSVGGASTLGSLLG